MATWIAVWLGLTIFCAPVPAGEWPYFITYSHHMEEPGNLEIATRNVTGKPAGGNRFLGAATELEYGVTGWWTTELYLDAQSTRRDSTLFTGYRWENRFRVLPREHWINPVLYIEFENINGADRKSFSIADILVISFFERTRAASWRLRSTGSAFATA